MQLGLGEVNERKVYSIRVSDNLMHGTPLLMDKARGVISIKYHESTGEGDKHFADVTFENGTTTRFFDIVSIRFYSVFCKFEKENEE